MRAAANALSVVRAGLALPFAWALIAGAEGMALALWLLAAGSDVLDGRLARRSAGFGGPSDAADRRIGAHLDVGADAVFTLSGLITLAWLGAVPAWLPLIAVAMLARFVGTASLGRLVYDPVGRHYGTLLYAVLGVWILGAPATVRAGFLMAVVLATMASFLSRTLFLRRRAEVLGGRGRP